MKQLLLRKGHVSVEDVPAPALNDNNILVEVAYSLISTGTELSSIQLSGASLIDKAKQRPKEVMKVLNSIKVRGLMKTFELVNLKLDESKPLGYSCSGRVISVGKNVNGFQAGDLVACGGAAMANHAEVVSVPANLSVKVPEHVDLKKAASVTLGAIALQGIRRADVRLGESACVMGLGLIGQLTIQLLEASGCIVIGMDLDPARVLLAKNNGLKHGATTAAELADQIQYLTDGAGVDATILTASTTSSAPTKQAFELTRKKGRIIVVGAVGMNLDRSPFYEKEQDFLISCSYGPGRYDPIYELQGHDYPLAYVRWTENRNMSSYLKLIKENKIQLDSLLRDEYPIGKADEAYGSLLDKTKKSSLGVILTYQANGLSSKTNHVIHINSGRPKNKKNQVGLIGVGNFTKTTHIPNLNKLKETVDLAAVCTGNSATAATVGRQLNVSLITTDYREILNSSAIDSVIISTRHDKHASMVIEALKAGKNVFVEKPLALEFSELDNLRETFLSLQMAPTLMVGFNRRYSPTLKKLKGALMNRQSPLMAHFRVNAGSLPDDHWTKSKEGGGRLRAEACHMIDSFQYLVGSKLKSISIQGLGGGMPGLVRADENFNAQFFYEDGSICNLIYTAIGDSSLPKELLEMHWDGKSAVLNDFKTLNIFSTQKVELNGTQDKGHFNCLTSFFDSIQNGISYPTSIEDLLETSQAAIELHFEVTGKQPV